MPLLDYEDEVTVGEKPCAPEIQPQPRRKQRKWAWLTLTLVLAGLAHLGKDYL
jgi:hypothetical protein